MKRAGLLVVWMILTVILTFTIIGMFIFMADNSGIYSSTKSSWMKLGYDLIPTESNVFVFLVWMFLTVVLVCSVVGLLLFVPRDWMCTNRVHKSTWLVIGDELKNNIIKQ
jgi:membrane-anchored glycerophosphoryl diester phosphodiesterase (GDPDase)